MLDLNAFTTKSSAKFGLAVTLIAFLAACSHNKVNEGSADLNPIPANEVTQGGLNTPDVLDAPTPIPVAEALPYTPPVGSKKIRHAAKHKLGGKKLLAAKRARKAAKLAAYKRALLKKKAAVVGQVTQINTPPPAPPVTMEPAQLAPAPTLPLPPVMANQVDNRATTTDWMIWGLGGLVLLGGAFAFRTFKTKKARRLVFNT